MKRLFITILAIAVTLTYTMAPVFATESPAEEPQTVEAEQVEETAPCEELVAEEAEEAAAAEEEIVVEETEAEEIPEAVAEEEVIEEEIETVEAAAEEEAVEAETEETVVEEETVAVEPEHTVAITKKIEKKSISLKNLSNQEETADMQEEIVEKAEIADQAEKVQKSSKAKTKKSAKAKSKKPAKAKSKKPGKVNNVKAKALGTNEIKISWNKVKGADGYKVYRYKAAKGRYVLIKNIKSGTVTSYVNKCLKSNHKKSYKVAAVKKDGSKVFVGAKSKVASAKTDKVKVGKVSKVRAKAAGSSKIVLSWSKVKGADGYKVYRYSQKKGKYVLLKTIKSGKTTSYKNKGLDSGETKAYKVSAFKYDRCAKVVGSKSAKAAATTKSAGAASALKVARSRLGCAYVSGCAGPTRFDCSGFVYYVYNKSHAGKVRFARTSAQGEYNQLARYNIGSNINNAKKGDILFFSGSGSTSGIYHTGIYIGGGKMIHAARPGKGVCVGYTRWIPRVCAICRIAK